MVGGTRRARVRRPRTLAVLATALSVSAAAVSPAAVSGRPMAASASAVTDVSTGRGSASAVPRLAVGSQAISRVRSTAPAAREPLRPLPSDVSAVAGSRERVLYLTFDDGPDPRWTPQVLALLARYDARATFFEVGSMVREHPGTARQVRAAGQAIGNHTGDHRDLTELTVPQVRAEIASGVASASCMRPPFGAVDARVRRVAAQSAQRVVTWSVDTTDWEKPGVAVVERHLLDDVRPGRIVLMHDGGSSRRRTNRR